jgi:hypothetical protein
MGRKIMTYKASTMLKHAFMTLIVACSLTGTATQAADSELYELRTYTTNDGKLEALHSRFRDHTQTLFEKHGMRNVAYWVPTEKDNTLVYLIAHSNAEAAVASWKAFVADPEWKSVYSASVADGPLVKNIDSVLLNATDYSPMQ